MLTRQEWLDLERRVLERAGKIDPGYFANMAAEFGDTVARDDLDIVLNQV